MIAPRRPSLWEADLPAGRPAAPLPRRVDVLVVGAGLMGRWLAYFLSRVPGRPRVLVVERDRFAYGASSRNAGFLTCGHLSEMLADIDEVGIDVVAESFARRRAGIAVVRRELPQLPLEACGSVDFDAPTPAGLELAALLNDAAGEEIYTPCEARLGEGVRPAMLNRADAGLDPVDLLRRLRLGAEVDYAFGVEARRVAGGTAHLAGPGGIHEVHYGRAVLCTNAFTAALDPDTAVRPGRGQIIVTSPVRSATTRSLGYMNAGYDYFRWLGDRLLLGGGRHRFGATENGRTELAPTGPVRDYLVETARRVIGHADFEVTHHWAGIMGFPGGRHLGGSHRRAIDDVTEAVAGFGGMGVALTPAVAEEVAAEFA